MSENKRESTATSSPTTGAGAGAAAKFAFDTVGGVLEGFGQFVRERPIWELIAAAIAGTLCAKVVIGALRDFLDRDPLAREIREEDRQRLRAEFMLDAEQFLDKCKEVFLDTFGDAYQHLQKVQLMNNREFREFVQRQETRREELAARRQRAITVTKWIKRIGLSLIGWILICSVFEPPLNAWLFFGGLVFGGVAFLVAVAIQNNNRPPVVLPVVVNREHPA